MRKLFLPIFLLFIGFNATAQCLTAPNGQWPGATFTPTCTGNPQDITTAGWAGEYSMVNVVAGSSYTFSSSFAGDYITIGSSDGATAYAFGTTPVSWTSTITGPVRFYTHISSACGAETVSRTRSVSCTNQACTGTPSAGTLSSTASTVCFGSNITLSLAGASSGEGGLSIQWQSAPVASSTFTDITAPNAATYTFAPVQSFQYRAIINCSNSSLSDTSNIVQVDVTNAPTYATFPYTQSFESWINGCSVNDRPDVHWANSPAIGNQSWRRNDQGADGDWDFPNNGAYTPAFSDGSFSARFSTYSAASGTSGSLNLFIDLSTDPSPTKFLKFDYINTSGSDVLAVFVSTDGGITFTQSGTNLGLSASWTSREFFINSTSATTVIRLRATSDFGVTDIGVDNLSVALGCSGAPTGGTTTATPASVCYGGSSLLTLTGASNVAGTTVQWQSSADGITWNNIPGATGASYNAPATGNFQYRALLTCVNGGLTATSTPASVTVSSQPTYATIPYAQSFESWIDGCSTTDRPDAHWGTIPSTTDSAWRRNDQGASANWTTPGNGTYSPASTDGSFSARFHTYFVTSSRRGIMDLFVDLSSVTGPKLLTFDYINTTGSDSLVLFLSENGGQTFTRIDSLRTRAAWQNQEYTINSNSATAVLRFRATSDFGVTDIGIDDLRILVPCTGTPNAGTIGATGGNNFVCVGNSTTLMLSGQSLGTGLTYQWESSTDDVTFNPIAGATGVNLSVSPAANTYYRVVVTCTNGGAFAATPSLLIAVNDPQIITTAPQTRCGPGTVTLGATGTTGAVFNWYTDATGGAPIFTGDNFTTPVLNANTTYYVSAAQGGGSSDVGFLPATTNCGTTSTSTATDWPLRFNTTSPVTLNSVYVIPVAAGNFTVALRNALQTTNILTANFTFTAAQVGVPQKLDLGWAIANAGTYQITNTVGGVTRIGTFTCNYPFTSAFGGLQIVGSATFSGSATNTNTYNSFFLLNVSEGCESARQAVTATVTPGPAFDVTNDLAICNDATQALTVTSPTANFDEYIWSPAANLFTDAAATVPYTGGSATTVYVKTATADTYTYVVNAENNTSGCTGIDSVKVTVLPGGVTIAATPAQICVSGQAALSLNPATGYDGASFQWQSSPDGTTYTDIAGATSQNYNTEVITTTTYYRVLIKDGAGVTCQQPTTMITVNSPAVLTTTPAALCGPGTMTLGATGTAGTVLNWYENATGGASVGTGPSFTTPNLTSTTTYYVSATAGGTIQGVGPVSVNDYPGASTNSSYIQGMVFDVFNAAGITIQSVDIFPTSPIGTNFQIVLRQGSGSAPVIATYQGTTTVTGTTANPVAQTVPVNFNVPGGFDYVMTFYDGTLHSPLTGNAVYPGALRNSPATGVSFPQAIPGELSITASTAANTWNYFYNWRIGTGCESPRVAVEAQVSENTSITTQPVAQSVCSGASVTFTVGAVGANLSYQWRYNGADIAGATGSTFTIPNASAANAGNYDVVITGLCGNATSTAVSLAVSPTNGWIGVTNTDWNTASNWCGGIPTATSDVVIPSGTPYQPIINGLASVRNLTISSGATVTLLNNGFLNIHGNYSNSGTFAAADGFVAFKGATNQDIAAMNVGSLIMNGTGGITLAGNMTVNDALILENGNITLGSHSLSIMGASSTQNLNGSSKGSASSHIVTNSTGSVLVNDVSASTVVPVGPDAASYNPVTIGNGQGLDYTVRVANGINPAIPYPAVAVNRTWTVTPGATPGAPVQITLQYADGHMSAPGSPTATMQVGAHNGTVWNIVSPAAGLVPVGPADGRHVTIGTTQFGPLVVTNIGGINIPTSLPTIDEDITSAVLMPNLIRNNSVLRVKAERTVRIDWIVVDMNGKVMMTFSRQVPAGQTDIPLDFSRFANGNYIMAGFTKNGKLPALKFVKM